ncbi:hypothetical protein CBLAS_1355 [Campylobacter blaseri]|uniref:FeoB-associated Cys-rich membrane protein n=1 Tax=Campylobacter blaseri TaxID=2042961 RepID=A0A2P8QZ07_9BACT|nr:FeoB-associated Cys-rich membrane protein [Campylobacter blaseri]PSM51472.1 FeoB-associated Cys-rich membrane protein [Campylobacter blaseri]PSM52921.1 FeoB-associated Cys-rich membrane protein [Campylobacter blaseri]QKF86522.1 hypothetical protein CBLAS_1355 [Campylobacter blaseri]
MQTNEIIFLIVVALGAGFYIYKKLFKSGGCGCGNKNCHATEQKKKN